MSAWTELYNEQIAQSGSLEAFVLYKIASKKTLTDIIQKYSGRDKELLEVGCGTGIMDTYLARLGYAVIGIDSDPDMISLATSIGAQQKSSARFHVDDLRTLKTVKGHFDLIFSNGVMEHFSDTDIVSAVNRHLALSDYVLISVPSNYFSEDQKMHGDERFMDVGAWRSILSKTRGSIVEEFNFDTDAKTIADKSQFIGFVLNSA